MSKELFEIIEQHNLDRLAESLSRGADPNAIQSEGNGWRPLHATIEELEHGGSIEALILLLRHGALVDGWDEKHDATPLLMSLFRGQTEAVRLLLAVGADTNVVGAEGDSPLCWSVEQDDYETASMILRCGATKTIDRAGGPSGMTALGRAASRLNLSMIKLLLEAGADPKALDDDHRTARERLPEREMTSAQIWDAAAGLLAGEEKPHG